MVEKSIQSARLDNSRLAVTLDAHGFPALVDQATGLTWSPFADGQGALLTVLDARGQKLVADLATDARLQVSQPSAGQLALRYDQFRFAGRAVPGELAISLELERDEAALMVTVEALTLGEGFTFETLSYPCHQLSLRTTWDDGYLVVPTKQGVIVPTRFEVGYMRFQHNTWGKIADLEFTLPFDTGTLNMPWYGAVKREGGKQSALLAYVVSSADAALGVVCNKVVPTPGLARPDDETTTGQRLSTLTPLWRESHGRLGYPRRLRLELIPGGDYVALAKRYRQIAITSGRYKTLKDKIAENSLVERIVGAPDIKIYVYTNRLQEPFYRAGSEPVLSGYSAVHTTFDQVRGIVEELHDQLGVDRALILLGGWIRAGYDREHPDVWPPAEGAGGVAGLSRASAAAAQRGYLFSLHDNYQDMYPPAPSYNPAVIMRKPDRSLKRGHIWDGGPCMLICSAEAIKLAEETVKHVKNETSVNSYYLDTTTAASLYECYSETHPLTRAQDCEWKLRILDWLAEQGWVSGGEAGTDWAIPVCTFFEGIPGTARGFYDGVTGPRFGISAPLFSLVYHDCVVAYWQHGQPYGREDHDFHVLHDLITGNPSSWVLVAEQWDDLKPLIKEAFELLGELHRRTAHEQLVAHRFLSADFRVQESRFAGGLRVVVNNGITSFKVGEQVIPPRGFRIEDPQDGVIEGVVERHIRITKGKLNKRR